MFDQRSSLEQLARLAVILPAHFDLEAVTPSRDEPLEAQRCASTVRSGTAPARNQTLHQTRGGSHRRSHEGILAGDNRPGARGFRRCQVIAQ